jgi:enoyl-CoA hydratase/carnithine racemase
MLDDRPDGGGRPVTGFTGSAAGTPRWQHLDVTVSGGVVTVTLNRPEKLNALTFEAYADLRDLLHELSARGEHRVVLLRGEGDAFCSGGDVQEIIGELLAMPPDRRLAFTRMTGEVVRAMRESPLPVVAAIRGIAAGAGSVLALASDFRVLGASSRLAFLFTKVGLAGADMGAAYLLPRLIGAAKATELLVLGDTIDAVTADRYGLATALVAEQEVDETAGQRAHRLADGPALAYAQTKMLITRELDMSLAAALELDATTQALLMGSADHAEFHTAFTAKRKPAWRGR